jgi:RNA polymerase sigma factor (sigma-70 family)
MTKKNFHQQADYADSGPDFKQLFSEHKKHVFAMALSILRDFELAEDVLQEVYIKLYRHMQHQEISNVKAWLISVSRNTALDLYRKNKREITGFNDDYFERIQFISEDPLDQMILSKYLQLLNSEERQIVIMKDILGMKHREIAPIIKRSLGTVLWKYSMALKKLRTGVMKEEF